MPYCRLFFAAVYIDKSRRMFNKKALFPATAGKTKHSG